MPPLRDVPAALKFSQTGRAQIARFGNMGECPLDHQLAVTTGIDWPGRAIFGINAETGSPKIAAVDENTIWWTPCHNCS